MFFHNLHWPFHNLWKASIYGFHKFLGAVERLYFKLWNALATRLCGDCGDCGNLDGPEAFRRDQSTHTTSPPAQACPGGGLRHVTVAHNFLWCYHKFIGTACFSYFNLCHEWCGDCGNHDITMTTCQHKRGGGDTRILRRFPQSTMATNPQSMSFYNLKWRQSAALRTLWNS